MPGSAVAHAAVAPQPPLRTTASTSICASLRRAKQADPCGRRAAACGSSRDRVRCTSSCQRAYALAL